MRANTIDDVLDMLATIVAETKNRDDPLGFFAAMARAVTVEVKARIDKGLFDDGERMARFDVEFANAYLLAYEQFTNGERPSRSWRLAFDEARSGEMLIVQNVLLNINAHISLDLPVTAGTMFRGDALDDFKNDFDSINTILAALLPKMRERIESHSPRLAELTAFGGQDLSTALGFSIESAREEAWVAAKLLSVTPRLSQSLAVLTLDSKAKLLGRVVAKPPEPVGSLVRHIRQAETTDNAIVTAALDEVATD